MGEARGRPYHLDACGSLPSTDERSRVQLQSIRRSLVSAVPTEPRVSRWRWPPPRGDDTQYCRTSILTLTMRRSYSLQLGPL